jgi:acyl dehydratase
MIDRKHIGRAFEPHTVTVEAGRLRFFARAIGETDPVYLDEAAARAAGHRSLPVPPTFLFSLELERPDPLGWFSELGLELSRVLHGEQAFTYHQVPVAGDVLTFSSRIADIYQKKNGALEFVVRETRVTDARGAPVAELTSTIIQRQA